MKTKKNLTEGVMWDKLRDKLHDLAIMAKSIGYSVRKIPNLYRLKKSGDEEGYKKEMNNLKSFVQNQLDEHPRYEKRGMLKKVMRELKKLDDLVYGEFDKDPSKFNKHQQDILLSKMKVTDSGIERDLGRYKLEGKKQEPYLLNDEELAEDEKTNVVNMGREKMTGDYQKTRSVIMSCDNWEQLKVGIKMYNQLNRLHELPEKDLDKLENLIGLMKIKCKNVSSYDVPKKIDERSSIGDEFHKAAQKSGVQDLRSVVFSEEEELKGGDSDGMSEEDLAEKHDVDVKDIKKEINVGIKIEMEHTDSKKVAKEIAMDHISEYADYYTDPDYGIIAIEDKLGDNKKTVRISKSDMDKLHNGGEVKVDGVELSYKENVDEDLDTNRLSKRRRDDFRNEYRRRESPREFEQIRRVSDEKPDFEDLYIDLDSEDEIEEATGAASSGSFVGPMGGGTVRRVFKKSDIPTTKNGIVGKRQTGLPIGKLYSFNEDKEVLEEEELDEATTVGGVGGVYDTPGFPASKFMGTAGKKGKAPVKKKQPNDVLKNLGYQKVRVKEKCKTFPYCNQSPEAIEFYNEGRVVKTIKKGNLKIK